MKSINKNKPFSAKKYPKTHQPPAKQSLRYRSSERDPDINPNLNTAQIFQFHLNDEDPQSIIAKHKLQEFSLQFHDDSLLSSFKRNQNSINMQKISNNSHHPTEGWVESELKSTQKLKTQNSTKHLRSQSASRSAIRQTLKIRTQNEKKFSFASTNPQNSKLNLSFNNLSPFHMEVIPETQLSKQLVKKVKSCSSRRPITASYSAASQKVLTLFEKESPTKRNKCDTMRIHSNKEVDPKAVTWKENRFLKTFSFNSINKSKQKRGSKKLENEMQFDPGQKENNQRGSVERSPSRNGHARTYSENIEQDSYSKCEIGQEDSYGGYSQRKMTALSQKRHILSKRIKSHENITPSVDENSEQNTIRKSFNRQSNLIGSGKKVSVTRIEPSYNSRNYHSPIKEEKSEQTSKSPSPNKHIEGPPLMSSNLEQDFSLLISMLKNESQHIFGGQLHSYLTQMKNNSLYSHYYSGSANRKKNGKLVLNTTGKGNMKNKGKAISEHDRMRGLIEQKHVKKNNTEMHYTGLSMVRDKEESGQFIRTSTSSFNQ